MKNKIVTHFYVKEEKKDNNGEAPIYLRITINGERAEISTNRRLNPVFSDSLHSNYYDYNTSEIIGGLFLIV